MNATLYIIGATIIGALLLGLAAQRGKRMNLEEWTVGGRGFGTAFVFVLMAGEIYTTFTVLGASGFAYGRGGAALYIIIYTSLSFVLSYWLLPPIWRYAKQNSLLTQSDFFARKYDSPALGILVAVVGVTALMFYLILQFKGLGLIVEVASGGSISTNAAIIIGAIVMTLYVVVSGVHGSAWTATIKDITILLVCVFLGLYLPYHYYGGLEPMFEAIERTKPGFLSLPEKGLSPVWYCTTITISALGLYMWPHTFGSAYTSRSEDVFRRNAIVMPLYALVMLFSMVGGYAAVLQVPGLAGGQIDLALLLLSVKTFDPWFVGVIGAAGVLTALVPGSIMLIAGSASCANNIYRLARPSAGNSEIAFAAKAAVPLLAVIAVLLTINAGESIVMILIMGFGIATQLFPALVASLMPRSLVTKEGAAAGIIIGVATAIVVVLTKTNMATLLPGAPSSITDINIGLIALALNVATCGAVSALSHLIRSRRAMGVRASAAASVR